MQFQRLPAFILSGSIALGSWALSEMVTGLDWLPIVVLPLAITAMSLAGALMVFAWRLLHR